MLRVLSERLSRSWTLAFFGATLYWMSLPPMHLPWAGFVASAFWVAIIAKECPPTRREYWSIWLAGAFMWLALLQGIRLAFWPLYAGWTALSLYLAVYLPMFVGMARGLHRWHVPLPLAAATAWVGCELIRAYFATGFAACMLAHSQIPWPWMLPIASQFGSYGVSFLVMFIGAILYQWWSWFIWDRSELGLADSRRFVFMNSAYSVAALCVVLISLQSMRSHDQWIASQEPIKSLGTVLLIQENMPTQFDGPPDDVIVGWQKYDRQNAIAAATNASKGADLVVWPESTFSGGVPWLDAEEHPELPPELELSEADLGQWKQQLENKLQRIYGPFMPKETKFLLGTDTVKLERGKALKYNSALWFDPKNRDACQYYSKQHLVMFGEYIPIISSFPSLLRSVGLGRLEAGEEPMAWQLSTGATVCPSICFEDVLPHVIHTQIRELKATGKSPDILVNITNDGWFRGSSILDHHLNNAILAAVENRRPMLVAANLGISAWIDGDGRVVRSLPRMEPGSILAEPIPDGRWGWWQSVGDWPARMLAMVSCMPFLIWAASCIFRKR
jgi:apolipoprotein N-acyltransferase